MRTTDSLIEAQRIVDRTKSAEQQTATSELLRGKIVRIIPHVPMSAAQLAAEILEAAPRLGDEQDRPEGSRYLQLSDTLARQLASLLRGG